MFTFLKVKCVRSLKDRITLPKEWKAETEDHLVFMYLIDDKMRFLQIPKDEDGAEELKENGFITHYDGTGKNVRLMNVKCISASGNKGQPIEWELKTLLNWSDVKFYPSDIIHMAARREYELSVDGSKMGTSPKQKGKLISLDNTGYPKLAA